MNSPADRIAISDPWKVYIAASICIVALILTLWREYTLGFGLAIGFICFLILDIRTVLTEIYKGALKE